MKFDGGNGDFAIVMILFVLLIFCVFVGLATVAGNAGLEIPTPGPIWPPQNAF